jgi:ABC-type uncharacterized transport system involved in gliding motility auxiliary subunit
LYSSFKLLLFLSLILFIFKSLILITMLVTKHSKLQIRTQNIVFVVLFMTIIGLLAWLSTRYAFEADWTAENRNTLSGASIELLSVLKQPVKITAYANEDETLRRRISELVRRYQRYKSDIDLSFINPETEPDTTRQLGIKVNGELVIDYEGRSEHLQSLSEQSLTNALQRLARSGERWIVFLEGHGERNPHGQANHDYQAWARQLENKGFKIQTINLADAASIPHNTSVLVIAGPQVNFLPGEIKLITKYVNSGGNLLWLADPGSLHGLEPIAEKLGVELQPGVIVDPTTQLFGINDPRFAVVAEYPFHAITRDFNMLTLFPQAAALDMEVPDGWEGEAFLQTVSRSWSETGEIGDAIEYNAGVDVPGPLTVGVALARPAPGTDSNDITKTSKNTNTTQTGSVKDSAGEQRIVIVGDGDFLSNAFLGNGGNLDLGMNIVNWLGHDDTLISIPTKTAPDTTLELSRTAQVIIGFGFLFLLPIVLAGGGLTIWLRRRKR